MEWIIFLYIAIGLITDKILSMINKKKKRIFRIGNLRIHHSTYGVVLLIVGFSINALIWVGIGIILGHSIRNKRLLFVEIGKRKIF